MLRMLCLAGLLLIVGCGDEIQFQDPPRQAGSRPRPVPGRPAASQAVESHAPAADPFADPDEKSATSAAPQKPAEVIFDGVVKLALGYVLPATYTVYVGAYVQGAGMPVCVRKYDHPTFPMSFQLRRRDIFGGVPPAGTQLQLGVILSESGSVTAGAGRYTKRLTKQTFSFGAKGTVITLSE